MSATLSFDVRNPAERPAHLQGWMAQLVWDLQEHRVPAAVAKEVFERKARGLRVPKADIAYLIEEAIHLAQRTEG